MFSALAVSGRLFEMTPSDILTILARAFWPLSSFRFNVTLLTPRFRGKKVRLSPGANGCVARHGSPVGGSILMTSAPMSARICPAKGPATKLPNSMTLIPSSGPFW